MYTNNSTYPYDNNQFKDWFTPRGWICPRCNRVNAPSLMQCSCSQYQFPLTTSAPTGGMAATLGRCPECGEYIATIWVNGEQQSGYCACKRQETDSTLMRLRSMPEEEFNALFPPPNEDDEDMTY